MAHVVVVHAEQRVERVHVAARESQTQRVSRDWPGAKTLVPELVEEPVASEPVQTRFQNFYEVRI